MPEHRKELCVIVVNWHNAATTLACAESLRPALDNYGGKAKLLVVDNGSQDDSVESLRNNLAPEELLCREDNGGFAAGVNTGIEARKADYYVLVNNDAVVEADFLCEITAPLDKDAKLGAISAHIVLQGLWRPSSPRHPHALIDKEGNAWVRTEGQHGQVLTNSTGGIVDAWGNGMDRDWLRPAGDWTAPREVFAFCGGACALRADALDEVGLMREDFFMYYEDLELSYRLRKAGWGIEYAAKAIAHHAHGGSAGVTSPLFVRCNTRNRLLTATLHASKKDLAKAWLRAKAGLGRTAFGILDRSVQPRLLGAQLQGFFQALARFPGLWRARNRAPHPQRTQPR
ncbi:MAG: glycosyltransferase family 2 protein [Actinomycetaceae bacterium]|nr:glycosyltransferase family 2 protein [Actinomycetaceae bacterium]